MRRVTLILVVAFGMVRVLLGGGDDAEAHFVRRALTPSDVAGRQLL